MRTTAITLLAISLVSLSSCNPKTDPTAILEDSETRSEIIQTISENPDYMTEFMENIQGNELAMQMMQGNKKMMGTMMQGQGMQMILNDSMMMKNVTQGMTGNMQGRQSMMKEMMKDGKMMGNMMTMMHEKGMMSDDCMKSSMKMMGDKGMNTMNNMDTPTKEEHTEHH